MHLGVLSIVVIRLALVHFNLPLAYYTYLRVGGSVDPGVSGGFELQI
jgi:hypothetical protein